MSVIALPPRADALSDRLIEAARCGLMHHPDSRPVSAGTPQPPAGTRRDVLARLRPSHMANDRLRAAMATAGVDVHTVAESVAVDPKTVERWRGGRVPHPRHRIALVRLLGAEEGYLW